MRISVRRAWMFACVGILAATWSFDAAAATLSYDAQLTIEAGPFETITTSASGTAPVAPDGSFTLPAGVFHVDQTALAPGTPTGFFTKASFVFHNGTGTFGGPSQPDAVMPLLGKVKLFAKPALAYPPASLTLTHAFTMGTATAKVSNGMTTASLSLYNLGIWRVGRVVQSYTTTSSAFGTRTRTGFDSRTAMGIGSMNLVIPLYLDRYVGNEFLSAPVTGSLSIAFTPEPEQVWLGGASFAALVLLGLGRLPRRG
jgi:hypothetical protein